jgi:hypothetical protein
MCFNKPVVDAMYGTRTTVHELHIAVEHGTSVASAMNWIHG